MWLVMVALVKPLVRAMQATRHLTVRLVMLPLVVLMLMALLVLPVM